jgi:hypothetical protein
VVRKGELWVFKYGRQKVKFSRKETVSWKVKKVYDLLFISEIVCRLHKSDRSTQKTDSRKKAAHASDDQEVSIVKVTLHA